MARTSAAHEVQQRIEIVKLFNEKHSMGHIAEKFNMTRAAIAGIIHRARLRPIPGVTVRDIDEKHVKPIVHRWGKTLEATVRPQPPKMVTLMSVPEVKHRTRMRLIEDHEVRLIDLKEHHCRYPLGDPREPDFRFCGRTRADGPYCCEHAQLAYRAPTPRPQTRPHYR